MTVKELKKALEDSDGRLQILIGDALNNRFFSVESASDVPQTALHREGFMVYIEEELG